jgi:FtsP/CotA-like multicopper oxidase with cupredoxin domain
MRDTKVSRRRLLTMGGATLAAGTLGGAAYGASPGRLLQSVGPAQSPARNVLHLAGTDGWVSVPTPATQASYFFPDNLAPDGKTTYVFGFRDVTGYSDQQVRDQKGKTQICAPLLWFDEYQSALGTDVQITVTNLGMQVRPDLVDGHTLHWHGFRNANPFYDGVPEMSVSVPIGRDLTYFYQPKDPGTYMYHCHFEDVEHVQMGMTGMLFVRPLQNGTPIGGFTKFAYNDADGSTGYHREFGFMLNEIFVEGHYRDAHIQTTDWTDFNASFSTMNGRTFPDTLQPNGDPMSSAAGRLRYQPISSLITANAGERVLLRLSSLGYESHTMTVDEFPLTIVGKDAALLKNGSVLNYITTNSVDVSPGESRDVIFTAPAYDAARAGGTDPSYGPYNTYLFYDRSFHDASNGGGAGMGGMVSQIRVYRSGLPTQADSQTKPNA